MALNPTETAPSAGVISLIETSGHARVMTRISLIVPLPTAESIPEAWIDRCRQTLERDGAIVETVIALPPGVACLSQGFQAGRLWTQAAKEGLVAAVMQGLAESDGDFRIVFDPTSGYLPEELTKILAPLKAGEADLVVARREFRTPLGVKTRTRLERLSATLSKSILGASDPLAGLVAMTSEKAQEVAGRFDPVGSRYAVDLLLRLKARKAEVPIDVEDAAPRNSLGFDDLRHFMRLADDRYGNISRLIQFCVIGASGMVVDLTCYAILQVLFAGTSLAAWKTPWFQSPADMTAAAALAIAVALTWNFSLNRRLTFSYARDGSILHQFLIYALSNALGIALSFTLRLYLPARIGFFARHRLAAAVVGIVAATGISFSMARWVVFRNRNEVEAVVLDSKPNGHSRPVVESTTLV